METQHFDVNNKNQPVAWDAMSPAEKRLAHAKKTLAKEDKKAKKVATAIVKTKTVVKASPIKEKVVKVDKKSSPIDIGAKVELKTICKELKLDPKAARRLLRKSDMDFHPTRGRWLFTEKQAEKARSVLAK